MTASATATRQSSTSAFADGYGDAASASFSADGEVLEHVRRRRGDRQQQEPAHARAGGALGGLGRRLDAQRDRGALVDERRVAADDAAGDLACRRPRAGRRSPSRSGRRARRTPTPGGGARAARRRTRVRGVCVETRARRGAAQRLRDRGAGAVRRAAAAARRGRGPSRRRVRARRPRGTRPAGGRAPARARSRPR